MLLQGDIGVNIGNHYFHPFTAYQHANRFDW